MVNYLTISHLANLLESYAIGHLKRRFVSGSSFSTRLQLQQCGIGLLGWIDIIFPAARLAYFYKWIFWQSRELLLRGHQSLYDACITNRSLWVNKIEMKILNDV